MKAGDLWTRVTIEEPTETRDSIGQVGITWATLCTRWANVMPLDDTESLKVRAIRETATHIVRLRYIPDLTLKHRITWRGKTLNIVSVLDKEAQQVETVVKCLEQSG
jgi:SPP1 family predicted phage head-tail adaptor